MHWQLLPTFFLHCAYVTWTAVLAMQPAQPLHLPLAALPLAALSFLLALALLADFVVVSLFILFLGRIVSASSKNYTHERAGNGKLYSNNSGNSNSNNNNGTKTTTIVAKTEATAKAAKLKATPKSAASSVQKERTKQKPLLPSIALPRPQLM